MFAVCTACTYAPEVRCSPNLQDRVNGNTLGTEASFVCWDESRNILPTYRQPTLQRARHQVSHRTLGFRLNNFRLMKLIPELPVTGRTKMVWGGHCSHSTSKGSPFRPIIESVLWLYKAGSVFYVDLSAVEVGRVCICTAGESEARASSYSTILANLLNKSVWYSLTWNFTS